MNMLAFRHLVGVSHTEAEAKELAEEVGSFETMERGSLCFYATYINYFERIIYIFEYQDIWE